MAREKSTKHWHAMNGSSGCIPDNNEIHTSKKSAARSMADLFGEERGVFTALMQTEIFYFSDSRYAGADYCEITCCHEADCLQDE